jgi:hypothetical protein
MRDQLENEVCFSHYIIRGRANIEWFYSDDSLEEHHLWIYNVKCGLSRETETELSSQLDLWSANR